MESRDFGYPYGTVEVPDHVEVIEVEACCPGCHEANERQPGHTFCNPGYDDRGRCVSGPVLTNAGWKALIAPLLTA